MGEWVKLTMTDGHELPCYHVLPEGELAQSRRGGLVLVQEIFGVTEHIRELCEEYAGDGYEVISPSLFDRIEPGIELGYSGADWERAVQIARDEQPLERSLADVETCLEWTHARGGPTFIVGYCYGGSLAWRMAQTCDLLDAASCYYGGHIASRWAEEAPRCATITHFGRYDSMVPIEPVEKLIEKQHPTAQHFIYEAGHGFNSDRRKDYHPESAELAKQRTLMLFKALGG